MINDVDGFYHNMVENMKAYGLWSICSNWLSLTWALVFSMSWASAGVGANGTVAPPPRTRPSQHKNKYEKAISLLRRFKPVIDNYVVGYYERRVLTAHRSF